MVRLSVGFFDFLFGRKVTIEHTEPDGTVLKWRATERWLKKMQQEGEISELSTVDVCMLNLTKIETFTWIIGQDISQEDTDKFLDKETGYIYAMTAYKEGKPIVSLLKKNMWDQASALLGLSLELNSKDEENHEKMFKERMNSIFSSLNVDSPFEEKKKP